MTAPTTNRNSFFDSPWFGIVWLGISALACLLFSKSISPLFAYEGSDSAIFKIIGQGILDGKLPYRDLFDHKGPIIFYLNALSLWMAGGKIGLWILNTLFLAVSLALVYRVLRLFSSANVSFWISLLSLLYWCFFSQGGNLTEGYALPAIALSLYLVLRLYQDPQKTSAGFFIGLCFSWMFLLRMNDAVMFPGALFAGFFLYGLVQKRYRQILVATLWFLAGAAALVLPFVLYFASQDALADFWFGQFTFNYLYAKCDNLPLFNYCNSFVFLFLVLACIGIAGKKKDECYLYFVFVPVAVFSFLLLGKRNYSHYFLVFLPFVALLISLIINKLLSVKSFADIAVPKRYYTVVVCVLLLVGVAVIPYHLIRRLKRDSKIARVYEQAGILFDLVPQNERNDIWLYNNTSTLGIFPHHNITPCNRIFCCWILQYDNLIQTEGIGSHQPNWVVVDRKSPYWEDFDYIERNYELFYKTDSAVCQLELYRWSGTEP